MDQYFRGSHGGPITAHGYRGAMEKWKLLKALSQNCSYLNELLIALLP
jgi:hypothetical protein